MTDGLNNKCLINDIEYQLKQKRKSKRDLIKDKTDSQRIYFAHMINQLCA